MNPARSLAPAVLSGVLTSLWLYWTATFIGTLAVALLLQRKIFVPSEKRLDNRHTVKNVDYFLNLISSSNIPSFIVQELTLTNPDKVGKLILLCFLV
jgi:hypothetical protein